ncbi:two-component system histidine kinase PnpS [Massilibacterium senegalense]|uniref:two-component system histidine kinase PnpS n=1 Tax=Massilibacterium senegalense TaxID=1632858 RepID=UPI0007829272|nr:ATP-binding protein [Massilibacterium senegalense]
MVKLRSRFIMASISLILLVLFGLGFILGQILKITYEAKLNDELHMKTLLVREVMEQQGITDTNVTQEVRKLSQELNAWITVFSTDQQVMANYNGNPDNIIVKNVDFSYKTNTTYFQREENQNVLYYALPITEKNETIGFIRLCISDTELNDVNKKIWNLIVITLSIAGIMLILLLAKITGQFIQPIEDVTRVSRELAKGNFQARTYEQNVDETGELSQSINVLARNLQQMTKSYEMQQERLETLIENMGSGLLLIDDRGYITLVNRSCKEMFHFEVSDWLNKLYYEVIPYDEVVNMIEEIFMTEQNVRQQMLLPIGIERRHFDVYSAPILGAGDVLKGIVLVFHDITELKKLEQMRKDFVANVSHELKTPITSIKGFSETLLDGAMEQKELREQFLTIILEESERLQNLIQELLDLSKIEQEYFQLNWETIDLTNTFEDVLFILHHKVTEKEITLTKNIVGDTIVLADPERVKQIMLNIIANAINYTPAQRRVEVSLIEKKEQVDFVVKDTGIGMEESEISRIFERFYRIDKARSRNSGGTGLGLAIVKHLVEAHHGEISVQSEKEKGSTFTITFFKNPIEKKEHLT